MPKIKSNEREETIRLVLCETNLLRRAQGYTVVQLGLRVSFLPNMDSTGREVEMFHFSACACD